MIATAADARASSHVRRDAPGPDLGREVPEREHDERQARVVVVLERGAVDAGPGQPLGEEPDQDQRQPEVPAPERLVPDEHHRRHAEPPDHEVAGVVDRGGRALGEVALVEPHRLEVERPRPPRRARGVRRGQVVVVLVHRAGQVAQRLARVAGRHAGPQLVALDHRPRDVRDHVHHHRDGQQRDGDPERREAEPPARAVPSRPGPVGGRPGGRCGPPAEGGGASGPTPRRPPATKAP